MGRFDIDSYLERYQEHSSSEELEPFLAPISKGAQVLVTNHVSQLLQCFGVILQQFVFLVLRVIGRQIMLVKGGKGQSCVAKRCIFGQVRNAGLWQRNVLVLLSKRNNNHPLPPWSGAST